MLPPDGEGDRFLITMDLKLVGYRRGKFVFCYVVHHGRSDRSTERRAGQRRSDSFIEISNL